MSSTPTSVTGEPSVETASRATLDSLVIVRATAREAAGAGLKVAGLTVVERALRQLARLPSHRVVVVADGTVGLPTPSRLPDRVEVLPPAADVDEAIAALLRKAPGTVVPADVVRRQGDPLTGGMRVTDEGTRRQAEEGVFADLLRGDLGFVARHINKKISFRITRDLLCQLPVTPNQVTLGAAAIGLLGCLCIAGGSYLSMLFGFVLVQLQSILDGCDGELARVRFQQSEIGEWLDTLADDFLNLALVASMGIGLWRAGHGPVVAVVSAISCGMLLTYNAVCYRELVRQGVGGELLKIRWKLARGLDMKSMMNEPRSSRPGEGSVDVGPGAAAALVPPSVSPLTRAFLMLGRRDFFIFSWAVLALLGLVPVALLWASIIAVTCFVTAVGQLVVRDLDHQSF